MRKGKDKNEEESVSREEAEAEKERRTLHEIRQLIVVAGFILSLVCGFALATYPGYVVVIAGIWVPVTLLLGLGYLAAGQQHPLKVWKWSWKRNDQEAPIWRSNDYWILTHAGPPGKYLWRWQFGFPLGIAYFIEVVVILLGFIFDLVGLSLVAAAVAGVKTLVIAGIYWNGKKHGRIADGTEVYKFRNRDLTSSGYKENEYPLMGCESYDEKPMMLRKIREDFVKTVELLTARTRDQDLAKQRKSYLGRVLGFKDGIQLTEDQEAFLQATYQEFFGFSIEHCPHCGTKIKGHRDFCKCGLYLRRYQPNRPHCYYVPSVYGYSFYMVLKTGDLDLTLPKELVTYRLRTTKARFNERFAQTVTMFPLIDVETDPATNERHKVVSPVFYVRTMPPGLDERDTTFIEDSLTRSNLSNDSMLKLDREVQALSMTNADLQDHLKNFEERGMMALYYEVKKLFLSVATSAPTSYMPLPAQLPTSSAQGTQANSPQSPGKFSRPLKYLLLGLLPFVGLAIYLLLKGGIP